MTQVPPIRLGEIDGTVTVTVMPIKNAVTSMKIAQESIAMGRHERRASIAVFRREARNADLITFLVDAEVRLDRYPVLSRALQFWRDNTEWRKPYCPNCKASFAGGAAFAGAFLLTTPTTGAASISVTAFCHSCWLGSETQAPLTIAEIEAQCTRVLRAVVPGGKFEAMEDGVV
jgi:hypothetical protein